MLVSHDEIRAQLHEKTHTIAPEIYVRHASRHEDDEIEELGRKLILNEAIYILGMDVYVETDSVHFREVAEDAHRIVVDKLSPEDRTRLQFVETSLFDYFRLERDLRVKDWHEVDERTVRILTRRKSSDVFAYATVLETLVPVAKGFLARAYTYQLLRDLDDDIRDIVEDTENHNPNPILLRRARKGITLSSAVHEQKNYVNDLVSRIRSSHL